MDNNKNHQITVLNGPIGFSTLDVSDEPKYQILDPYELTNAILLANEQYNDCFLLHSTIPPESPDEFLQKVKVTKIQITNNPIPLDIVSPQAVR